MLFEGSVGRADFPDSNPQHLIQSIRSKLYTLPEDTIVYTGHGDATTIGRRSVSIRLSAGKRNEPAC